MLYSDTQVSGRTHEFGPFFVPMPGTRSDSNKTSDPRFSVVLQGQPSPKKSPGWLLFRKVGLLLGGGWLALASVPSPRLISGLPGPPGRYLWGDVAPIGSLLVEGCAVVKSPGAEHVGNLE